jgi:muconolactone delta-isomerase
MGSYSLARQMVGRFFKRMFRKSGPARFDSLFEGPDADLIMDLVGRIEGPNWRPEQILSLSHPEAHVVQLCRFDGIFGNGGLQYWFECDSEIYGKHTSEALRAVGLAEAAGALDEAYAVFPTQQHYDDFELRMAALRNQAVSFQPLEQRLWRAHGEIAARAADYARRNKHAFEHLRNTRPWCPIMRTYGDA